MNKNITIGILVAIIIILGLYLFLPKKKNISVPEGNIITPQEQPDAVVNPQKEDIKKQSVSKKVEVKVYAEKDTTGDRIVVASGEQMNIIASSNIPATITYTIKYSSSVVYPGAVSKETTQTSTVSVYPGLTKLLTITADAAKVNISFTYTDNSNKSISEISPAPTTDTTLTFEQDAPPIEEFTSNSPKKYYHLISRSNTQKSVTYTITYTDPESRTQKTIHKTVVVPLGKKDLEKFTSYGEATLNYSIK